MTTLSRYQDGIDVMGRPLRKVAQVSRNIKTLRAGLAFLAKGISVAPVRRKNRTGKTLILPGLMGSRLSVLNGGSEELVWLHPADIAAGGIAKLKWPAPVKASGMMTFSYLKMLLRLRMAGLDAEFVPFDWRQSPAAIGASMIDELRKQGQTDVTLVCHSMGGLVARQMTAADPRGAVIGRVITIGTPNHGSYAPVQMLDLSHPLLDTIARIDRQHDVRTLVSAYLRHFPGLIELLPSPARREAEDYFRSSAWPAAAVSPRPDVLVDARAAVLALPEPDARFHQIIGTGQETVVAADRDKGRFVFGKSCEGDGVVPCDLAEMGNVPRYYARCAHGQLCNNDTVIAGVIDLIANGQTEMLGTVAGINGRKTPKRCKRLIGVRSIF